MFDKNVVDTLSKALQDRTENNGHVTKAAFCKEMAACLPTPDGVEDKKAQDFKESLVECVLNLEIFPKGGYQILMGRDGGIYREGATRVSSVETSSSVEVSETDVAFVDECLQSLFKKKDTCSMATLEAVVTIRGEDKGLSTSKILACLAHLSSKYETGKGFGIRKRVPPKADSSEAA